MYGHAYLPRLLFTLTLIPFLHFQRHHLASACFALFLVAMLLMRSFASPWLLVGWAALLGGFFLSDKNTIPRPLLLALVGLLLLHVTAIPGSIFWGNGNWEITAGVVLWMAPALLLCFGGTLNVLPWLMPVWFIHAGMIIFQGFTDVRSIPASAVLIPGLTPTGLTNNGNLAAGFLVLGLIYMLTSRHKWAAAPLMMALLFTGSRWGVLICVVAILLMAVANRIDGRTLAMGALGLIAAFLLIGLITPYGYRIAGYESFAAIVHSMNGDVATRLAMPHLPSFLPAGIAEHPGLHNVPLRIAVENGILAAGLWVLISGWALTRQVGSTAWWLLLTLVLLSMLDYYAWMGHLGAFWWLLIAVLAQKPITERQSATL